MPREEEVPGHGGRPGLRKRGGPTWRWQACPLGFRPEGTPESDTSVPDCDFAVPFA